jgi:hypothetical protein
LASQIINVSDVIAPFNPVVKWEILVLALVMENSLFQKEYAIVGQMLLFK